MPVRSAAPVHWWFIPDCTDPAIKSQTNNRFSGRARVVLMGCPDAAELQPGVRLAGSFVILIN